MASTCDLSGNSDLYGLGVRTGVYCQLLATVLANHGVADALTGLIDTNVIFLLAVLIALITATVQGQLSTVEAFVMLQIIMNFLMSAVNIDGWRWFLFCFSPAFSEDMTELATAHFKVSRFGTYWRQMIRSAAIAFTLWFWFYGLNHLDNARKCNFQVFYVARLDGFAGIKYLYRIFAVYLAVHDLPRYFMLQGIFHGTLSATFVRGCEQADTSCNSDAFFASIRNAILEDRYGIARRGRDYFQAAHLIVWRLNFIYDSIWLIFTVLCVELTLVWSNVHDVYEVSSTGQLIPLVIGFTSLLQVAVTLCHEMVKRKIPISHDPYLNPISITVKNDQYLGTPKKTIFKNHPNPNCRNFREPILRPRSRSYSDSNLGNSVHRAGPSLQKPRRAFSASSIHGRRAIQDSRSPEPSTRRHNVMAEGKPPLGSILNYAVENRLRLDKRQTKQIITLDGNACKEFVDCIHQRQPRSARHSNEVNIQAEHSSVERPSGEMKPQMGFWRQQYHSQRCARRGLRRTTLRPASWTTKADRNMVSAGNQMHAQLERESKAISTEKTKDDTNFVEWSSKRLTIYRICSTFLYLLAPLWALLGLIPMCTPSFRRIFNSGHTSKTIEHDNNATLDSSLSLWEATRQVTSEALWHYWGFTFYAPAVLAHWCTAFVLPTNDSSLRDTTRTLRWFVWLSLLIGPPLLLFSPILPLLALAVAYSLLLKRPQKSTHRRLHVLGAVLGLVLCVMFFPLLMLLDTLREIAKRAGRLHTFNKAVGFTAVAVALVFFPISIPLWLLFMSPISGYIKHIVAVLLGMILFPISIPFLLYHDYKRPKTYTVSVSIEDLRQGRTGKLRDSPGLESRIASITSPPNEDTIIPERRQPRSPSISTIDAYRSRRNEIASNSDRVKDFSGTACSNIETTTTSQIGAPPQDQILSGSDWDSVGGNSAIADSQSEKQTGPAFTRKFSSSFADGGYYIAILLAVILFPLSIPTTLHDLYVDNQEERRLGGSLQYVGNDIDSSISESRARRGRRNRSISSSSRRGSEDRSVDQGNSVAQIAEGGTRRSSSIGSNQGPRQERIRSRDRSIGGDRDRERERSSTRDPDRDRDRDESRSEDKDQDKDREKDRDTRIPMSNSPRGEVDDQETSSIGTARRDRCDVRPRSELPRGYNLTPSTHSLHDAVCHGGNIALSLLGTLLFPLSVPILILSYRPRKRRGDKIDVLLRHNPYLQKFKKGGKIAVVLIMIVVFPVSIPLLLRRYRKRKKNRETDWEAMENSSEAESGNVDMV